MNKISFERDFLCGLYLYLLQIELSIDRALNGGWKEMAMFFNDKNKANIVIETLLKDSEYGEVRPLYYPEFSSLVNKKRMVIFRRPLFSSFLLYEDEIVYICEILRAFDNYLQADEVPEDGSLIKIRMGLYDVRENIARMIDKSIRKRSNSISHFNHNLNIEVQELETILGTTWLKQNNKDTHR